MNKEFDHPFQPHMWKPNLCSACFQPHSSAAAESKTVKEKILEGSGEERDAHTDWEFKHRLHVDPLRKAVLTYPFVENVHFKSTINNREGAVTLIGSISISSDFDPQSKPWHGGGSSEELEAVKKQLSEANDRLDSLEAEKFHLRRLLGEREIALLEKDKLLSSKDHALSHSESRLESLAGELKDSVAFVSLKQKELDETNQLMTLRSEAVARYEGLVTEMQAKLDEYEKAADTKAAETQVTNEASAHPVQEPAAESEDAILARTKSAQSPLMVETRRAIEALEEKLRLQAETAKRDYEEEMKIRTAELQAKFEAATKEREAEEQRVIANIEAQLKKKIEEEARIAEEEKSKQEKRILELEQDKSIMEKVIRLASSSNPQPEADEEAKLKKEQAALALAERVERARTTPIIEPKEGFMIWRQEVSTTKYNKNALLDYPENDVYFYRDNFMLDPKVYTEIEEGLKYFSPQTAQIIQQVRQEQFHDHLNLVMTDMNGDTHIASIRCSPTPTGDIWGLIRAKVGDRTFLLDLGERGSIYTSSASSSSKNSKISPSSSDAGAFDGEHTYYPTKELIAGFRKKFVQFKDTKIKVQEVRPHSGSSKSEAKTRGRSLSKSLPLDSNRKPPPFLPQDLLELDRKLKTIHYKFGVLYASEGQTDMAQILMNKNPSPAFTEFLDLMGDKIKVKGWKGYKADLDVKSNTTCVHAYYTMYQNMQIMFHVAPLLFDECRTRIIGNDISVFVWLEEGKWHPSNLSSQVLHNQIVIRPIPSDGTSPLRVKVEICGREGTEQSTPPNIDTIWELNEDLREFLLRKTINCERAAWHCGTKVRNQQKSLQEHFWGTREGQFQHLAEKYADVMKEF